MRLPHFTFKKRLWRCSLCWIGLDSPWKKIVDHFQQGDVIRIWFGGFLFKAMVSPASGQSDQSEKSDRSEVH